MIQNELSAIDFSSRFDGMNDTALDHFMEHFYLHKMSWDQIEQIRFHYGFYFNDVFEKIDEDNNYDFLTFCDDLFVDDYYPQIDEAVAQIKSYLNLPETELIFFKSNIDFTLHTTKPLPDPIVRKLIFGLNSVQFEFDLFEFTYYD